MQSNLRCSCLESWLALAALAVLLFSAVAIGAEVNHLSKMDALASAIERGDVAQVSKAVSDGANLNASIYFSQHPGALSELWEAMWHADASTTPLCLASQGTHPGVVAYLLAHGADPNRASPLGYTPITQCLQALSPFMVVTPGPWARQEESEIDWERANRLAILQLLIAHGANVNNSQPYQTPLCLAVRANRIDTVAILLKAGADPNGSSDEEGTTPLLAAAGMTNTTPSGVSEEPAIVKLLLAHGADPNNESTGFTPVGLAIADRHYDVAQVLLHSRQPIDVSATQHKASPLSDAVRQRSESTVQLLLARGPTRTRMILTKARF